MAMKNTSRINSIGAWLKDEFGEKVIKLSIDGGFTCPNRDGTKGVGGCIFCSAGGSGELASNIPAQMKLLQDKWPNVSKYIAYFQSHTSTYAPVEVLEAKYREALSQPQIIGLAIATRPDCLSHEVLDLLDRLNRETFLWVELGLQTVHHDRINRCYDLSCYDEAVENLISRGIRVVTHLILGLPGEDSSHMTASVKHVCKQPIFGIKLHLMNVVKGSAMEGLYPGYTPFSSPEEYIHLVCDLLEIIPADITIHRLTGDVPRHLLIAPPWSYKKRTILNGIAHKMKRRGSYQGCSLSGGPSLPSL
jgi:radical SAM protein (TIGR01212 family)